ncbi:MAG: c-type cytochrome [Gaiella sp.]
MAGSQQDERRGEFKRYKDDVKREGKPFFPYAIFHDTVMAFVTVVVIIGLAVVWYVTAESTEAGVLGPWYTEEADAGTIDFIPRPDWFFYFLFYLLRVFKWPETVVLGTVGVPTLLLILLIALPFYDRRRERRPSRRPVAMIAAVLTVISMGVLTWKGATAEEALGSEIIASGTTQVWAQEQGFAGQPLPEAGAKLFAQTGCLNCHIYLGEGSQNLGAPDLSDVGATDRGVQFFKDYLSNPAAFGNNVMISYSYLGDENLTALASFLNASKGPQASEGEGK